MSLIKTSLSELTSRKKHKMSSSQNTKKEDLTVRTNNLILDVPQEILQLYTYFLDLKSNVMFNCVCRKTNDKRTIKTNEYNTLSHMFGLITNLIGNLQNVFSTQEGQDKLLAVMLRRLIYTSVSDISSQTEVPYVTTRTFAEYTRLMTTITEKMDISVLDFNNLLEDAQFEFRGFSIINITDDRRNKINEIKSIIRDQYFSKEFTIHTCTTFGDMYVEFQCNNNNFTIDVHERLDDDLFTWMFLTDSVRSMISNGCVHPILSKLKSQNIQVSDSMISWQRNNYDNLYLLSDLVHDIMDCSSIFKGCDDNILEVWNDTMEVNWLLRETVKEVQVCGMYLEMLKDITNAVQDKFEMALLC